MISTADPFSFVEEKQYCVNNAHSAGFDKKISLCRSAGGKAEK